MREKSVKIVNNSLACEQKIFLQLEMKNYQSTN